MNASMVPAMKSLCVRQFCSTEDSGMLATISTSWNRTVRATTSAGAPLRRASICMTWSWLPMAPSAGAMI